MCGAAAVLVELKLDKLGLWQMALQLMLLLVCSPERLRWVLAQQLGMDMLVVVVCLVPKVVSKACVDTSSLLKTPYAP